MPSLFEDFMFFFLCVQINQWLLVSVTIDRLGSNIKTTSKEEADLLKQ